MKTAALAILAVFLVTDVVHAQDLEAASGTVFSTILRIIIRWIFPVCAAYCFLHGIIGKGVKRGEWDMAVICIIAAVSLALFPKLLSTLFGVSL